MAIADMFLKLQGVTGEAGDSGHKGEIDVVSWSWGMEASRTKGETGRSTMSELHIVKRVDQSSPTLMSLLRQHKPIKQAQLTVRKAGSTPLEYFTIELEEVLITSLQAESQNTELMERVSFGFSKVRVSYVPQGPTGGRGGGANIFEADAYTGP